MNIKSSENISIFLNNNIHSPQNRKDSSIKAIEKQIKNVQEQLEELNKKLMQTTLESQQKEREKKEIEMKEQVKDEDSVSNIRNENLILLSSSLKQISLQSSVSTKMKGEARVLASEIKLDEGRGLDVTSKKEDLAQINVKVENINKKIGEKLKNVNEQINKSNEKINVKK